MVWGKSCKIHVYLNHICYHYIVWKKYWHYNGFPLSCSLDTSISISHCKVHVFRPLVSISCYISTRTIWLKCFHMSIVRSTLRHCGVCSKGQSEGVSACASSAWDGVLLQPRPGACGEHVIQRPGVLRLPGGTWHGLPRIQEGWASQMLLFSYQSN